jgi:UDPglucose--hexose-1-phosphate uridylyltransferase
VIDPEELARAFAARFGRPARVHRAPGRVNLIGEHTDYNDGLVMPMALDRSTWVSAAPRDDGTIVVRSREFDDEEAFDVEASPAGPTGRWTDYVRGVATLLQSRGADMLIASDVPIGAGLSSSAALEVACASALADLAGAAVDPATIAQVCQRAEHEFVGTRCGIMDQMIACSAAMGASNPHPHCQIWATEHIPNESARELAAMTAYRARRQSCLLCDYVALEIAARDRLVCANDGFVALVPFWAGWPFETLVASRRHVNTLSSLGDDERDALADILRRLTTRYDNVFEAPFPYSMGFHQQPFRDGSPETSHVHAHFYPPLLRSATVRKFMVGFELLGSPQRDLTPEEAAERLRQVSSIHYGDRSTTGKAR